MSFRLTACLSLMMASVLCAGAAPAQPTLVPPREVVIYIHRDLDNVDFVEPLVCQLSRVLVAPVRAQPLDFPIDLGLMASPTQLDAEKVATRLLQTTARDGGAATYMFLIVPHDLRTARFRFVFGASFGAPYNAGVISTSHLAPAAENLATLRMYKMILRYVAQLAGLTGREGCVLAMPRSLDELDAKPAEFCDADHALLVDAGVIKPLPGGACGPLAATR